MSHLLIDISNSFTKLALATEEKTGAVWTIPTGTLTAEVLKPVLSRRRFSRVILSSVVPARSAAVRGAVRVPILEVTHRIHLGIGIDYPKPASIGADRLVNAAAARGLYGAPCVVVDFGTAVTFDILSPDGDYVGGVICPGLAAMTEYLHQRTALLPRIRLLEPPAVIGKSTKEAMLSGAVHGYRGLVRQVLLEIKNEIGSRRRVRVVATGGYADLIAAKMPEIQNVHPGLTMEGLRILANLNPL